MDYEDIKVDVITNEGEDPDEEPMDGNDEELEEEPLEDEE